MHFSSLLPSTLAGLLGVALTGGAVAGCGGSSGSSSSSTTNNVTLSPVTGTTLTNAVQSQYYSQRFSVSSGGSSPYAFSEITSGLPAGLFLVMTNSGGMAVSTSSYGDVIGFPQTAGVDNVEFRVYDANNDATDPSYELTTTAAAGTTLTLTPVTGTHLTNGTVGDAYSAVTLTIGNGTPTYAWSVVYGSLPPGLTLTIDPTGTNTAEARIGGMPTVAGTWVFAISVQDSATTNKNFGGAVYQITVQ